MLVGLTILGYYYPIICAFCCIGAFVLVESIGDIEKFFLRNKAKKHNNNMKATQNYFRDWDYSYYDDAD